MRDTSHGISHSTILVSVCVCVCTPGCMCMCECAVCVCVLVTLACLCVLVSLWVCLHVCKHVSLCYQVLGVHVLSPTI